MTVIAIVVLAAVLIGAWFAFSAIIDKASRSEDWWR